jgi:caffeoyl-CoA O-methyltransferase
VISFIPEEIQAYADAHSSPEAALYKELAEETRAATTMPQMMVGHAEGLILKCLVRLTSARRVLEIGTFTGYSTLAMAEGLPDDGELVTCDIDPHATSIAKKYWARSPHGRKIRLELRPALETLETLAGPLDLVFLDADKENYRRYWDACVPKVRRGGAIVADNVLWSGEVLAPKEREALALAAFNQHVARDARVEHVMLPIRDGITLAVVR